MAVKEDSLRKTLAAQIMIDNADLYKVCLCCESVVSFRDTFCPLCEGYRFDENIEQVIKFIEALVKRDKTTILPPDQQL
jgi:hypothetical protein